MAGVPLKLALTLVTVIAWAAPAPPPGTQDARIGAVLHGLRPRLEIAGRAPIRWTIEDRMSQYRVPGVSIAVIENGKIAWARGVGVKEAGKPEPVTPDTLFQAGSVSKPVAVSAMLRLVERGTLNLDTDVNRYLTSWKVPENQFTATEKVTLRRIVSHSAGLTVNGFRGYPPGAPLPTAAQVLSGTPPANSPPVVVDTVPGTIYRYSGGGLTVMQQVMVDVTGTPFHELVRQQVLARAGMDRSTYEQPLPAARAAEVARGHTSNGALVPGGWHTLPELAAAGLWTTPTDLAKWAIAIADARAGRATAVLSQDMAKQMLTLQKDSFALGLPVNASGKDFNFWHSGSNVGFRAHFKMFPELGAGVVVMTNGDTGGPLNEEIIRSVAAEYGWPVYASRRVTPVPLDAAVAAGLAGQYVLRVGPGRPIEMRLEDGKLTMHGPMTMVQELVPESATRFVTATAWSVEFFRDASGKLTGGIKVQDSSGSAIEGERKQ
jgi:CubicO group peptidase (beta-lactamase class C family)